MAHLRIFLCLILIGLAACSKNQFSEEEKEDRVTILESEETPSDQPLPLACDESARPATFDLVACPSSSQLLAKQNFTVFCSRGQWLRVPEAELDLTACPVPPVEGPEPSVPSSPPPQAPGSDSNCTFGPGESWTVDGKTCSSNKTTIILGPRATVNFILKDATNQITLGGLTLKCINGEIQRSNEFCN